MIKKIALIFSIIFAILTLIGGVYVICTDANAGYSVIPMIFAVTSSVIYKSKR